MALCTFRYAFGLSACSYWPTLSKGQTLPDDCKSVAADPDKDSHLGLGFVEALSVLLCGKVEIGRDGADLTVSYLSNRDQQTRVAGALSQGGERTWHGTDSMKGPALVCLLEAAVLDLVRFDEVKERWAVLLDELLVETGTHAPYAKVDLQAAARQTTCQRAMMALTDAIYFAVKGADAENARHFEDDPCDPRPAMSSADLDALFDRQPLPTPALAASPRTTLQATLEALCVTGGTALLIGPTGTFKTTTATRAAQSAGATLTVVKGRPGIEDRDFFGGVTPTKHGPAWIDGPVTRAFRKAQEGSTVLLMDEILRFEPLFLGALVGLLDPASPDELSARGLVAHAGGAHYVASLPTGEHVTCPAERLTLIATTNMGRDYVQAAGLDAALMGRFELVVDVEEADPDARRALYEEACQTLSCGAQQGADLLEALEAFTREHQISQGGLLERTAHPRLMLNMARHTLRLEAGGMDGAKALQAAAEVTVVPYCAQRGPDGLLDPSGRQLLIDEAARLAEKACA